MDQQSSVDANNSCCILNTFGLINIVNKVAHKLRHTIDLVIDRVENLIVVNEIVGPQNTIPVHMVLNSKNFGVTIPKIKTVIKFRNGESLEMVGFLIIYYRTMNNW